MYGAYAVWSTAMRAYCDNRDVPLASSVHGVDLAGYIIFGVVIFGI